MIDLYIRLGIFMAIMLSMAILAIIAFKASEDGYKRIREQQNIEREPKRLLDKK